MRKLTTLMIVAMIAIMAIGTPVSASKPLTGGGQFCVTGFDPVNNLAIEEFTGVIQGTVTQIIQEPSAGDLLICDQCTINLGGEAIGGGVNDQLTLRAVAPRGQADTGSWTILGGTGAMKAVHGHGTYAYPVPELAGACPFGLGGTYTGQFHVDPK